MEFLDPWAHACLPMRQTDPGHHVRRRVFPEIDAVWWNAKTARYSLGRTRQIMIFTYTHEHLISHIFIRRITGVWVNSLDSYCFISCSYEFTGKHLRSCLIRIIQNAIIRRVDCRRIAKSNTTDLVHTAFHAQRYHAINALNLVRAKLCRNQNNYIEIFLNMYSLSNRAYTIGISE